jgi:hypothetical protein
MTATLLQELEREERERTTARHLAGTLRTEAAVVHGDEPIEDGPEVRTCAHCGERVAFRVDPLGSWAECPVCGHLA